MEKDMLELKKQIRKLMKLDFVHPEDIPDKEMFMEELLAFMDKELSNNVRDDEEKTLTKAMINNYTKNKLLPPPEKKRYTRDHLIYLIYIYYMKGVMSISDIQKLMETLQADDMTSEKLYDIYKKTFDMEKFQYFNIESSVAKTAAITEKRVPADEDEKLNKILLIFMLGYDIYSKKRLIERLIDEEL